MISSLVTKLYSTIVISFLALYSGITSTFIPNKQTTEYIPVLTQKQETASTTIPTLKKDKETFVKEDTPNITFIIGTTTKVISHVAQEYIEDNYQENVSSRKSNPCDTPIHYTLGSFDTRFNISKKYFLERIEASASLWNKAVGKELFVYDKEKTPTTMVIDLIYDDRQKRTDETVLTGVEIDNTKQVAEKLKSEYELLEKKFTEQKNIYMQKVEAYNTHQEAYNDLVASWNEKGGAPKNIYDELTQEKESLQKDVDELTLLRDELNKSLAIINTKIDSYNKLVLYANTNVATNNKISRKKFTEGLYTEKENKIYIYQFANETKLKRVLTHELGHALGIGHTQSDESIMYAINNGTNISLHKEDILELKKICSQ